MTPETLTWIEKQKPTLVGWAETFVKDTKLHTPKKLNRKPPHPPHISGSQLRNLLNAAQSGSSLAVLINFLRYQIGREKQGWSHRKSGEALETLFDKPLRQLSEKGTTESATDREAVDRYELEAHLAAQLMGFIIREYTYRCSLEGTKP